MALLEITGLGDTFWTPKSIQFCGNFTSLQSDTSLPSDLPRGDEALFGSPFVTPATYNEEVLRTLGCDEGHGGDNAMHLAMLHGTTTLGFRLGDGVIIAVDSRATAGAYIASQTVRKIIDINKYLVGTMAGGAADCAYWERVLSRQCRIYELRNKERISVSAASKLLSNILYNWKGYGLSVGTMLAGYDKQSPALFYVDSDGQRFSGDLFAVGSGSTYAYAVLDREHKMTLNVDQAQELAQRAIANATFRDAFSGGICRVCHVTKEGVRMLSETDVTILHERFAADRARK